MEGAGKPRFRNIGRPSPDKGRKHMARRTALLKTARRCFILHAGCRNVLVKVGEGEGDHFSLRATLLRQLGAIFRARLLVRCTRRDPMGNR